MGTAKTVAPPAPDDFELRMSLADALRCLEELRERVTDAGVRYAAICRTARGAIRGDVEAARGYVTAALDDLRRRAECDE